MVFAMAATRQIYGSVLIFEIEMIENHRCKIADVKIARL